MQKAYVVQNNRLQVLEATQERCWINLTGPQPHELQALAAQHDLPLEYLETALDPDERSRYEFEDGIHLIVVRTPLRNDDPASNLPYVTRPLTLVIRDHLILTISQQENPVVEDLLAGRVKRFNPEHVTRFVLQVFSRTALRYLQYLRDINERTSAIELELRQSQRNEDLIKLLNYEKSLVYFTTSLRANQIMMERFKRTGFYRKAVEDERELLEDTIIDNTQAIEMANIYTNILSGLMDAFASVISNNLNVVMKTLTKITVVLMVPTLLASLYGMNVRLPFQDSPQAFALMALACLGAIGGVLLLFRNRRF